MGVVDWFLQFLNVYGYYFLFFATLLENIPVVGIFLPGEIIVVAAGFAAASGEYNIVNVLLVAFSGSLIGTSISYFLGYRGGRSLIELIATKFGVDGKRLDTADKYFTTHGNITVFIGRYLTGVKAFIPALAGAHRMRFSRFIVFATIGVVSWTILAALLGYFFGANWDALIEVIKTVGWVLTLIIIIVLALVLLRRRRRR
ncbi:MAG TPA: DedA family protein [Actinobacteria bacterium]|nr:DedA family protein [Actinomycetota bacterium]